MTDTLPNAMNCTHCGTAPEMRRDESRGLFMPACPQCKFHAEPCFTEPSSIARWNRANEEQRPCLGCGSQPRLRHSKLRDMWFYQCKGCGWRTGLVHTAQGALCAWHTSNKENDAHYRMLWQARYDELVEQRQREKEQKD